MHFILLSLCLIHIFAEEENNNNRNFCISNRLQIPLWGIMMYRSFTNIHRRLRNWQKTSVRSMAQKGPQVSSWSTSDCQVSWARASLLYGLLINLHALLPPQTQQLIAFQINFKWGLKGNYDSDPTCSAKPPHTCTGY